MIIFVKPYQFVRFMSKEQSIQLSYPILSYPHIHWSDNFIEEYGKFEELESFKKTISFLNERRSRLQIDNLSYRIINHWEKNGLIQNERPEGKGWRKYSITEVVWVHLIHKMRSFGLPLEKIRVAKDYLQQEGATKQRPFPILDFYIARALAIKEYSYVLVFQKGEARPCTIRQYHVSHSIRPFDDHIKINLNSILQRIFSDKDLAPIHQSFIELKDDELAFLFMLRMGKYDSIKVKGKDGKIEMLEGTEKLRDEKRIIEILKDEDYQNIEIKQRDGKIVTINSTVLKKL